jgi:hypothetical protein
VALRSAAIIDRFAGKNLLLKKKMRRFPGIDLGQTNLQWRERLLSLELRLI